MLLGILIGAIVVAAVILAWLCPGPTHGKTRKGEDGAASVRGITKGLEKLISEATNAATAELRRLLVVKNAKLSDANSQRDQWKLRADRAETVVKVALRFAAVRMRGDQNRHKLLSPAERDKMEELVSEELFCAAHSWTAACEAAEAARDQGPGTREQGTGTRQQAIGTVQKEASR